MIVEVEKHGGAALVRLNLPQRRNVISAELVGAIGAAFDSLEADPHVRAVVLTGAGSAFCAGAELSTLRAAADGDFANVRVVYDGFLRVLRSPLATIAAANGPAVGAGFNLALACDIRLAGKSASFDTRFAKLRLHPGGGHTWLLARAVGQQQAMRACLFGEIWDAEKARAVGLVSAVHEDAELVSVAIELARRLDDQDADFARRLTATLRGALDLPNHAEALAHETAAQEWSTRQPAFKAGVEAIEAQIARAKR